MVERIKFQPFFPSQGQRVHYVAGPCSAESEDQVVTTARALQEIGIDIFRAGVWKPRTRPNAFEGHGETALKWLQTAKNETGLTVATEVASPEHLEAALKHDIDVVWIGARTSVNPFSVQAIADALRGVDIPVMIKNPLNPDLKLWIGAIERIHNAGIEKIAAIHRGFSSFSSSEYRNPPRWQMAIELRRLFPELTMICDSSHICGNRTMLESVAQQALDLGYDGVHLEVHPNPDAALSDAMQQITPQTFAAIKSRLIYRMHSTDNLEYLENLENLRSQIDDLDDELINLLSDRMQLVRRIGQFKGENNISILQPERWNEILNNCLEQGHSKGLNASFISNFLKIIHQESIEQQSNVIRKVAPTRKTEQ
jgi:chorismate mutase